MTSYLGQLGALGRVNCGAAIEGHGSTREMTLHWSPGGQVGGRRSAHRAPRTWTVRVPIDDGVSVHAFALATSQSSCVWLPADAVGGNLLTPEQVAGVRDYETPMWSNSIVDAAWSPLPDGRYTTNTIVRVNASQDRLLLGANGQAAKLPVVPGQPIHCSVLLSQAGAFVDVVFYNVAGQYLTTSGAAFSGPTNVLTRTTITVARVPAAANYAVLRVRGGGRIAEPVVTLSTNPPTRPLDGRGVEAVHVGQFSPTPITVWDQPGSLGGVRSAYEFQVREVNSL